MFDFRHQTNELTQPGAYYVSAKTVNIGYNYRYRIIGTGMITVRVVKGALNGRQ